MNDGVVIGEEILDKLLGVEVAPQPAPVGRLEVARYCPGCGDVLASGTRGRPRKNCGKKECLRTLRRRTRLPPRTGPSLTERRAANSARIDEIKRRTGCQDCGWTGDPIALDFDHIPGFGKSFSISQAKARPWDELWEEINKCEVVCARCHRLRTALRRKRTSRPLE